MHECDWWAIFLPLFSVERKHSPSVDAFFSTPNLYCATCAILYLLIIFSSVARFGLCWHYPGKYSFFSIFIYFFFIFKEYLWILPTPLAIVLGRTKCRLEYYQYLKRWKVTLLIFRLTTSTDFFSGYFGILDRLSDLIINTNAQELSFDLPNKTLNG